MVIDGERSIVEVAKALGLVEQTLGNWVRQARVDRGEHAGLTTDERAELVRLRRENAQLKMERDLSKRATAFWVKESALMTRCWWVDSRKAEGFPMTAACEVAGISTTTFYDWAARGSTGPSEARSG